MTIGKSVPQLDGWDKVTGRAIFGEDIRLSGMLVGKILRSPLPHARVKCIDVSDAKKVPGVLAVITAEDTPKEKVGEAIVDEYPLALGNVRYIGDEVAAVRN